MRRLLVLLLTVIVTLTGCTDGGGGGRSGSGTASGSRKGSDADGKRPATVSGIPTSAGTHRQKLDVGTFGHREYLLHVPPKPANGRWRDGRPAKPLPLVIALHGGLATMDKMRTLTGFDDLADDKGFLVAYPDGFMTTWNAGDCCGAAKIGKIDDVGFLSKLIDRLTGAGLADARRVYVTGFSNGAGMAYRMACEKPGKVAAIGVVEGALVTECDPDRPVAAMIFHGTADRNVPFNGGGRRDFNDDRPYPPVSYAVDVWRDAGNLPRLRPKVITAGAIECDSTGKGARGAEVTLCRVRGGTHEWPSRASSMLWDFFADHTRA
ncbi:hypothetical protein Acsp04_33430 [Actinomadura sp. NBRC 104425]|uniref:alpha/beta hydrolase family esterase n=1 Tax=Actinomadura sp. NBRC 104425 TaxID=3032204 RepID=UPI0024A42A99|nr:PHB depolymerase family esterase [Actinomadura sp. NBRC 104425]GLZ13108.1 hypothetical protein Acsp04_33430 [Actinomadura sp. NBRC 104425]